MGRKILFITTDQMRYNGTEGELCDHANDPQQWRNLWNEPRYRLLKSDLTADLYDHLPPARPEKLSWITSV